MDVGAVSVHCKKKLAMVRGDPPDSGADAGNGTACNGAQVADDVIAVVLSQRQHGVRLALQRKAVDEEHHLYRRCRPQDCIHERAHVQHWQLPYTQEMHRLEDLLLSAPIPASSAQQGPRTSISCDCTPSLLGTVGAWLARER